MMEAVASGALDLHDRRRGRARAVPAAALGDRGAVPLARRRAHGARSANSPIFEGLNKDLVAKRGMRMLAVTYYGKRHLTTGSKPVRTVADMAGFKLRVPPVDTFRAMAEAWGARATPVNFNELYLALEPGRGRRPGEPAADDPERQAQRGAEVPGADRPHHHAAAGHRERGVPEEAVGRGPRHRR